MPHTMYLISDVRLHLSDFTSSAVPVQPAWIKTDILPAQMCVYLLQDSCFRHLNTLGRSHAVHIIFQHGCDRTDLRSFQFFYCEKIKAPL